MNLRLLLLALAFATTACAARGNYTRSAFGTEGGYSLANAKPKPPVLMVARKIDVPLYVVLDQSHVKDTWDLETAPCATNAPRCERFKLFEAQSFVRRDLKAAMESYFSRVEIVDSADGLPPTPHVVADVRVDDFRLNALQRGPYVYQLIEMTWAFALRPSGQDDYAYSFAGTSQSNDSYPTFEAGCATLVENALTSMLKKWVESNGPQQLREGAPAPAPASGEPAVAL